MQNQPSKKYAIASWNLRYLSLLVGFFFGASSLAFLRMSSSVELCVPFPELRFLVFGRIRFCMDGRIQGAKKFFGRSIFGSFGAGRLVSGPVFLSISGISIFAFLFGILFNGTCHAKTAPETCHSILGFLDFFGASSLAFAFADILRYFMVRRFAFCCAHQTWAG